MRWQNLVSLVKKARTGDYYTRNLRNMFITERSIRSIQQLLHKSMRLDWKRIAKKLTYCGH